MVEAACGTGAAPLGVVGQPFELRLAAHCRRQVTELSAQLQPALTHVAGGEGRVVVRRDIPVIGQGEIEAGLVRLPHRRRQEARLALSHQRKLDPWQVEDRHVLEDHRSTAGHTDFAIVVELELTGADVPVGIGRRACRPGRAFETELVLAFEIELVRRPAARHRARRIDAFRAATALAGDAVGRRVELADLFLHLELHAGPAHDVAALAQFHIALGHRLVGQFAIRDAVGLELDPTASQAGVALGAQLHARAALDAGSLHLGRGVRRTNG